MARYQKQNLTQSQLSLIRENIRAHRAAVDLYRGGAFDNIELRTFYRRYKDEMVRLGVETTELRRWTSTEEEILRESLRSEGGIRKAEEDLPDRTGGSILHKAGRFIGTISGLTSEHTKRLWTKEEILLLEEALTHMRPADIYRAGILPGRSKSSIRQMVSRRRKGGKVNGDS